MTAPADLRLSVIVTMRSRTAGSTSRRRSSSSVAQAGSRVDPARLPTVTALVTGGDTFRTAGDREAPWS